MAPFLCKHSIYPGCGNAQKVSSLHNCHSRSICYGRVLSQEVLDKYTYRNPNKKPGHIQNVERTEIKSLFIRHIRKVIFELNEPRTLQGLLLDYKDIFSDIGKHATGSQVKFYQKATG